MDIRKQLQTFKSDFDRVLARYMDARIADARERDAFTADGLARCKKMILAGGKRLRPALTVWSYQGMGGTKKDAIMHAAMSVELIHAYLLIHDDIMDRDALRHGVPTLHAYYAHRFSSLMNTQEALHAGNSIALVFGDLLNAIGNHALFSAPFEEGRILTALTHLQDVISYTGIGQLKDVMFEYDKKASVDDVLTMYEYKTARYTIESPLILGAILAGVSGDVQERIHAFARPLGVAFQIRDDIIGLFGNEKTIGKPVGSDIAEGKITLLVALARTMASANARKKMNALLGKHTLSQDDVALFRTIITESGARAEAEARAEAFIAESKKALATLPYTEATKETFTALASYLTQRHV